MKIVRTFFACVFCGFGFIYLVHFVHLKSCPYPQNVYIFLDLMPTLFVVFLAVVLCEAEHDSRVENYLLFHVILLTIIADTFLIVINRHTNAFMRGPYFDTSVGFQRLMVVFIYLGLRKYFGNIDMFRSHANKS